MVRLTVDGDDDQATEKSVPELGAGQEREIRFDGVRLKQGDHHLSAVVDARQAIAELNEQNNVQSVTARCKSDS